ncbi:SusC/RagA family TonB-linked outer membrane protein [Parapedobacter pyrenivorans]|uniref:SusC/RagA family TonB-linked outer membrane protein n=1 Tax=Parapedobacter pyrenivorans TaxID=1305674 RepID=A0A917HJS2_9SPHI|nr:TonB-dependent receptor [Parapedobacter pyrenivorans]GGG81223.1 SusC/RagA family TonB-linked outer membrane protein [Parapedobacter pyrenivorans]
MKEKDTRLWRMGTLIGLVRMRWLLAIALYVVFAGQPLSATGKASLQDQVTGLVVDSSRTPLAGATVLIKGTAVGTQTDKGGRFAFPGVGKNDVLVVTYTGYTTQEVQVTGSDMVVVLEADQSALDEVVVVAFGTQKKTDMVGAVTSIKPSSLRVPSSNLTTALAGQAAGIIAYQRSGEPGQDNADFFIRGVTSFGTGKVDPLILIDGVELSTTELARLRPDDIESFSIMKDATSTALYGARGANGVIFVTTKQGKEGAASISFRAETSLSAPTKNVELADPVTFMRLYNDAQYARNPFDEPLYPTEKIDMTAEGVSPVIFPAVDWRSALFKNNTLNHRYNLNVSGGGKVARYYVAGSLAQDNGVLRVDPVSNFNNNIDLKSYTLRANVNVNLTKSTELIVRLSGNFDDYTGPIQGGSDIYNTVIRTNPVDFLPFYPKDEAHQHVQHVMFGGVSGRAFLNPYADMVKGYKDYNRSLMMAQMEIKQDLYFLTEGLTFRSMFNTNRISRFDIERAYKPFFYQLESYDKRTLDYEVGVFNETAGEEFLSFTLNPDLREQQTVFYMENALNYSRVFNERHSLSGMLVSIMRSGMNAKAGSLQLSLPSRNFGVSGRATYAFDSRYFAEFNFGYNGSERFYKDKRFGFFPSFGLAWTVSNEEFWKPFKDNVNNLRLRATYGLVGNDAIGEATDRFFYLSNVEMNADYRGFAFGRESGRFLNGIDITRYSNIDITWEKSQKLNLALELGLFNKITVQADYFREKRSNILMDRADIPSTMGLTAPVRANVGEAEGQGIDVSVDYAHSFSNGLWLQARGNFTYATNKYLTYEEPQYEQEWWKSRIGYPLSQQWGFIAERLFVDDNEVNNSPAQNFGTKNVAGDIKYKDVNGDGEITALDMVPIGYPTVPEIIYGGGFSIGFKNFDLSAFFQGSAYSSFWTGGTAWNAATGGYITGPANVEPFVGGKQIIKAYADSHYSLENPDLYARWPRFSTESQQNNTQLSTWWLNNGAFLRLKQVEMGYSLPQRLAERMYMKNLRLYVSGSNLFLISGFKLWDVEMGGNGLGYPLQRVYNLGINLTF